MSLRRFLNVAYAILVEEYQRLGKDLITALEMVSDLGEQKTDGAAPPARPAAVAASNEASMSMLQGMLGNVQNAPMKRKPRKTK